LQYNLNQNLNQNLNLKGNLMSLKSQVEYTATPEFEPLEDDIFATTQPASASLLAPTQPAQGPEVIPPPNTAVGAVRPKLIKAFHDKELAIPIEDVRQWFMASPAITSVSGGCKHSVKGSLGKSFVFQIDSYNVRFLAVPGSNDKEAKMLVRNLDDGSGTLKDYIESLKAQGYPKAHVAEYCDLWGRVVSSDRFGVTDPNDDSWDARVQLSATSARNFNYFCGKRGKVEASGLVPKLEAVEITAVALEGKSGDYTNFNFSAPKL
jgi:hypothetical protein